MKYPTLIALALMLAACSRQPPTETFPAAGCHLTPTAEARDRRVQTTCAFRSGGNQGNFAKPCLMWNHRTARERKYVLSCSREEWREGARR